MPRWTATEEDEREAVQRLLVGLSSGQDVFELSATIADLHHKNDTFPGEVYIRLAAEVLADTSAAGAGRPIGSAPSRRPPGDVDRGDRRGWTRVWCFIDWWTCR